MEVVVATLLDEFTFNYIYGAREDVPIKPDPAGAFQLAELLKLKPEEIIYAGDSSTDMLTGKAAGMFTVGVSWGFRTREELKEHGADAIIDDPLELLELLG